MADIKTFWTRLVC